VLPTIHPVATVNATPSGRSYRSRPYTVERCSCNDTVERSSRGYTDREAHTKKVSRPGRPTGLQACGSPVAASSGLWSIKDSFAGTPKAYRCTERAAPILGAHLDNYYWR
jgi:hypothetical protein